MKKALILILAFLMTAAGSLLLTSCETVNEIKKSLVESFTEPKGFAEDISLGYTPIESDLLSPMEKYEPVQSDYSFNVLDENEKALYKKLEESVYLVYPQSQKGIFKTQQVIMDGMLLSEAKVRTVIKALCDDHPTLFWLSNVFGHLVNDEESYTAVQVYSNYSPDEIEKRLDELEGAVERVCQNAKAQMNAYEVEKYVHDYLIDHCDYDEAIAPDDVEDTVSDSYNVYGALVKNVAVCEGYSKAIQLLLNSFGIDCVCVTGVAKGELHMWNAVSLGGDWYDLDATWDDQKQSFLRHDYFNLDDKTFAATHETASLFSDLSETEICGDDLINATSMNLFVPACDAIAYNYAVREYPHMTDIRGEAVSDGLLSAARDHDDYFSYYIDPKALDFDDTIEKTFAVDPQVFFSWVEKVNSALEEDMLDSANVHYSQNEMNHTVTIELTYV